MILSAGFAETKGPIPQIRDGNRGTPAKVRMWSLAAHTARPGSAPRTLPGRVLSGLPRRDATMPGRAPARVAGMVFFNFRGIRLKAAIFCGGTPPLRLARLGDGKRIEAGGKAAPAQRPSARCPAPKPSGTPGTAAARAGSAAAVPEPSATQSLPGASGLASAGDAPVAGGGPGSVKSAYGRGQTGSPRPERHIDTRRRHLPVQPHLDGEEAHTGLAAGERPPPSPPLPSGWARWPQRPSSAWQGAFPASPPWSRHSRCGAMVTPGPAGAAPIRHARPEPPRSSTRH